MIKLYQSTSIKATTNNPKFPMSQPTTDGDEPTQFYMEPAMGQDERFNVENWPHDRQPNVSQYSDDSDASRVICSLDVSLAQGEPIEIPGPAPTLVPETPPSTPSLGKPKLSKEEAAEQIARITTLLESQGYTVFTHKTSHGGQKKTMHLAFLMYDGAE